MRLTVLKGFLVLGLSEPVSTSGYQLHVLLRAGRYTGAFRICKTLGFDAPAPAGSHTLGEALLYKVVDLVQTILHLHSFQGADKLLFLLLHCYCRIVGVHNIVLSGWREIQIRVRGLRRI